MLKSLGSKEKVIGAKQSRRAIRDGRAREVFLATDADPNLTEDLAAQCARENIPVIWQYTMTQLGQAAGIQVGAAVVAVLAVGE